MEYEFRRSIWNKDLAKLEDFLKNNADPNKAFNDPQKTKPLYSSVINGNAETTELLLKYNADPNLDMNVHGVYAITSSVLLDRDTITYYLLKAGADIHKKCGPGHRYSAHDNAHMFNKHNIIDMFDTEGYRKSKEKLFILVLIANRLTIDSSKLELPVLPREMWRKIVVMFSPYPKNKYKLPF